MNSEQSTRQGLFASLRTEAGPPAERIADLIDALYADNALDTKTRELIYIGVQTALRLHGSIRIHVPRAIRAGATRMEVLSAMMTAVPNAGMNGPIECWPIAAEIFDEDASDQGR